jgi:Xaa-Pro aminopeptidase
MFDRYCSGLGNTSRLTGMNAALALRRERVARSLSPGDTLLVIGAGDPIPLPEGSDQTYPFRAHAEYFYLTGQECAGGVLAFDARGGTAGWTSFVPAVSEGERVWEGRSQTPGTPLAEFGPWLADRKGRPIAQLGAPRPGINDDPGLSSRLREALRHARRPKDEAEIALLRRAVDATARGYASIREFIRPGRTERDVQIELEAEFFRGGADRPGYGTIIGSGPNSAVLHFAPSARAIQPGEFVLIDAGAEIKRYMADVTRTYVAGTPTAFQKDLHAVVLAAEESAIARCVAGTEWKEIHLAAAVEMTAGLVTMGVMRGAAESLVEQEAHTLFFPHGLGHMVGLGVRDGSGLAPGRSKDPRASLRTLRMDLPLAAGYVVTVEPGLYFIPPLLNDPARRARYRDCINWPLVEQHVHLGGVRIEDNVLVTTGAPEVLTKAISKHL